MAQSVERLTLDFGSGHDLMIHGFEPPSGSVLTLHRLLGILSLSPSLSVPLPPACARSLSLKINFKKLYYFI